jgi:hypothetical protein
MAAIGRRDLGGLQGELRHARDDCELATRFPGFWPHVIANLAYAVAAAVSLGRLAFAVAELRAARSERFSAAGAVERYFQTRQTLALVAGFVGILALLPVVTAVA